MNSVCFDDLSNELLALIVEFISPDSISRFAAVSTRTLSAVLTVHLPHAGCINTDGDCVLGAYFRALRLSLCLHCNILYTDNNNCLLTRQHDQCDTCAECHHHTNKQLMHNFEYRRGRTRELVTKCRFGCNWYCRICDQLFRDGVLSVDGAIVCNDCLMHEEISATTIIPVGLLDDAGYVRNSDDTSGDYFDSYQHDALIERYDPDWYTRVAYECHFDGHNRSVKSCHIDDVRGRLCDDMLYSDHVLESISGLFGADDY